MSASTLSKSKSSANKKTAARKKTSSKQTGSTRSTGSKKPAPKTEQQLLREKEIAGIVLIALSVLLLATFILAPHPEEADPGAVGVVSLFFNKVLRFCAGRGALTLPLLMLVYGILVCVDKNQTSHSRLAGLVLVFCTFLGLLHLGQEPVAFVEYFTAAAAGNGGGVLGAFLDFLFLKTLGKTGAIILYAALLLIGVLLIFQTSLGAVFRGLRRGSGRVRQVLEAEHSPGGADGNPGDTTRDPWHKRKAPVVAEAPLITDTAPGATKPLSVEEPLPPPAPAREGALTKGGAQPEDPAPSPGGAPSESVDSSQTQRKPVTFLGLEPEEGEKDAIDEESAETTCANEPEGRGIIPPETPFVRDFMPTIDTIRPRRWAAGPSPEGPGSIASPLPSVSSDPASSPSRAEAASNVELPSVELPSVERPNVKQSRAVAASSASAGPRSAAEKRPKAVAPAAPTNLEQEGYTLPPTDLIEAGIKVRNPRLNKELTDSIGVLEATLESFGVRATVTQVVAGPAVTRYELQPAPGVKVSRITSLADDIALTLAAQSVRIEAPIPGKSAIGIEVSRKEVDTVYFREMIESEAFQKSKKLLSFVLGKNIAGECVVADLSKMPHLLIAGTTGSGKSVCVNTLICSILYKARPDQVKMMLIDPKKVEMMQYAHLPHLIAPVVNDSKKASNALKWVVEEMESRYTLFVDNLVKDFEGYNAVHTQDPLPHIVVIIDELADLMMVARHDVEDSICRIAQMARAAGIHLVVATQRPSVDVITGLIKSNIPSRIAFAVSSYTDSRTILDMGGAEKLVGRGDMLYAPVGMNKPMRIQGSYIDPADVSRLVEYCSAQASPSFSQAAVAAATTADKPAGEREEGEDELLYDAGALIIGSGQASVSYLQRRLAIGNPRAARLMDMLEAKGVVGCSKGSKPRDILMSMAEYEERFG